MSPYVEDNTYVVCFKIGIDPKVFFKPIEGLFHRWIDPKKRVVVYEKTGEGGREKLLKKYGKYIQSIEYINRAHESEYIECEVY